MRIYEQSLRRGFRFSHVCEVGVYMPADCDVVGFIRDGIRTTLIEPEPGAIRAIREMFGSQKNVTLLPFAVYDYNGKVALSKAGASTFVSALAASPALENDRYKVEHSRSIEVECKVFSDLDDGTIDLLDIDIEGADWYVLKNLKSRPKVISIETHGKFYTNPFLKEIREWMEQNGYEIWYKDNSDTVYVRKGLLRISVWDLVRLSLKNIHLFLKKQRRVLSFRSL